MSEGKSIASVTADKYDKYEVQEAARTLIRAEEIKQNKKLSKLVMEELDKQISAAQKAKG